MRKVLLLGAHGMLGSMVRAVLCTRPELELTVTARREPPGQQADRWRRFDARRDSVGRLLDGDRYDWIVNAIGITKPRIDERAPVSVKQAVEVNALFPIRLARAALRRDQRVIEIATDGVFSGVRGPYDEDAQHDAVDVYGKTKSLGEVPAPNVVRLRCSIVGPELSGASSLLSRVLSAPPGATVPGFTGQRWNGVTTMHFAKLCAAVVLGVPIEAPQHVIPADWVSKAELLELAASAFDRGDLEVRREPGPRVLDRRLSTLRPAVNRALWAAAGYAEPPTVAAMIGELAATAQ